jgi:ABC-type uncharacterized transport system ATPase component
VGSSVKTTAERIVRDLRPDLADRLGSGVNQFSGGERQVLALGLVMAASPRVLVLDEPTSALDLANRKTVQAAALRVINSVALTTLWITHDPEEAVLAGSRVVILSDGAIARDIDRATLCGLGASGLRRHLMATIVGSPVQPQGVATEISAGLEVA